MRHYRLLAHPAPPFRHEGELAARRVCVLVCAQLLLQLLCSIEDTPHRCEGRKRGSQTEHLPLILHQSPTESATGRALAAYLLADASP